METRNLQASRRFDRGRMQKVPLFESGNCYCDLYCFEPGQEQRIHRHAASDKIYYVVEGEGVFHIGGEDRRLAAGETVIARPDQDHGVRNESPDRLVLLVFMAPRP